MSYSCQNSSCLFVVMHNIDNTVSTMCNCNIELIVTLKFSIVLTLTVTISPTGPIQGAMVGSPQVIVCTVNTFNEVQSSSVVISWIGPNGNNIMNASRVIISPATFSGNIYTSSLQFTYVMEGDEGTYTCNVTILEISESQSVILSLLNSKL